MWRSVRYDDLAREVAYITRGIGDYFGAASVTRDYHISWKHGARAAGATDVSTKQVIFQGSLLNGQRAPLTGAFVDQLSGIAAHEAGHVLIHAAYGYGLVSSTALEALARNAIEDMAIDGAPMQTTNPNLGALTVALRTDSDWADVNRRQLVAHWQSDQQLDGMTLLRLWACSLLFRCESALTPLAHRTRELSYVARLNPIGHAVLRKPIAISADTWEFGASISDASADVVAIIQEMIKSDSSSSSSSSSGSSSESDSSSDSSDSSSDSDSSSCSSSCSDSAESADGTGAGKGPLGPMPELEPTEAVQDQPMAAELNSEFWADVAIATERLGIAVLMTRGCADITKTLKPYTDPHIVSAIRTAYNQLASEPSRAHRQDSGRIDRRQLPFIRNRQDVFMRNRERTLKGTLALVIDLSGSTYRYEPLIKRIAASVYLALRGTEIKCYIYGYGIPTVYQIASPSRVVSFDTFTSSGSTPTAAAILAVVGNIKAQGQSVLIHVTDGEPTGFVAAQRAMKTAKAAGWSLINIGVGRVGIAGTYPMSDHTADIAQYEQLPAIIRDAVRSMIKTGKARV